LRPIYPTSDHVISRAYSPITIGAMELAHYIPKSDRKTVRSG
jgi:hypothetical protein